MKCDCKKVKFIVKRYKVIKVDRFYKCLKLVRYYVFQIFFIKKIVLYFVRLIEMIYYKFIYWKSLFLERYMLC